MWKTVYLMLIVTMLITSNIFASNCFIELSDLNNLDIEKKRKLIESYGGRIIHEFPPNEFICDMETSQYQKFILSKQVSTSNHIDDVNKTINNISSNSTGNFYWNYLKDSKSQKNDITDNLPLDTLVHNSDFTGKQTSVIGWGRYEFDYKIYSDTIVYIRTAGHGEGFNDTTKFEVREDTLIQIRINPDSSIAIKKLIKI